MTTIRSTLLGFAAALMALHSASATAQEVRIATDGGYPPFNSQDSSQNVVGFEPDLYKDLCKRMNKTCSMIVTDYDGIIPSLNQGRFDVIMAGMSITEARLKVADFSVPYADLPAVIMVKLDGDLGKLDVGVPDITFDDLSTDEAAALAKLQEALNGRAIGVQTSSVHHRFSEEYFKDSTIQAYDTMENAALDLAAGRIDAFVTDLSFVNDFTKTEQGKGLGTAGPNMLRGMLDIGRGALFNKNNPELRAEFDKAIEAAIADGTIKSLSEKWFGFDITPRQ